MSEERFDPSASDLAPPPMMSRRHFLIAGAGGLTIGVTFLAGCEADEPTTRTKPVTSGRPVSGSTTTLPSEASTVEVNAWVSIANDNSVTVMYGGSEFGQGTMTGLAQILAEELRVPWDSITVKQVDVTPGVSYLTGGSFAVRSQFGPLANAGAAAREMLVSAAAATFDVPVSQCVARDGKVVATIGGVEKSATYGELVTRAAAFPVPQNPKLTDPSKYQVIGKSLPRVDLPKKINGSAVYGLDVRVPGMVFAAIKHAPVFGAVLEGTPTVPAGAANVVPIKALDARGAVSSGSVYAVAVVASNTWLAMEGCRSLSAQWDMSKVAALDSDALQTQADQLMKSGDALTVEPPPANIDATLAAAPKTIDASYSVPYLAHACMEVLNCTVDFRKDACEVWVPTQSASSVVQTVQRLTGLAPEAIQVHTTFLGGGLGRKSEQDFVSAAVQVAMKIRKPVMLMYPREEDFGHDRYRPKALVNVKAAVEGANVTAWKYRTVSTSILGQLGFSAPGQLDSQAVEGSVGLPYGFGLQQTEWVADPAGIPVGFWRSVGSSINAFAVECAIDELAEVAGVDPIVFRRGLLQGNGRATAVLDAADALSAWRTSLPAGHGWGVAYAESFGSLVCQVAEVSEVSDTSMRVNRIACVVDCGRAINPSAVEMQMQGGIAHGLSATLWGEMTFTNGAARVRNLNNHRVLRLDEMPQVDVKIVTSGASLGGIGEPGVPPVAPAIANAYFSATGKRIRALPIYPQPTS